MTLADDRQLRDALQALVERDRRGAPAFAATIAGPARVRRLRPWRICVLAGALAAAIAIVMRPQPASPLASVAAERDPLLASATGSFLVRDTPDFTSSFALARRMASYSISKEQ
jgi:hypothetical protein